MRPKLFWLLSLFLAATAASAQKYYDFNSTCQQAYHELLCLKLDHGKQLLAQERQQHPNNLIPVFLENYADLYVLFFNEDPAELDKKKDLKDARLSALKKGPESSPWHLYTQAMLQMQWAAIHLKFGEKWAAGWSVKAAAGFIKDNQKLFPGFYPNKLISGPVQVAAGTIPSGYKWLGSLLGLKGNIKNGMNELHLLMSSNDPAARICREEAQFYYCYLKFYIENKPEEALNLVKTLDVTNNHLFAFMGANLSLNNQQSAQAQQFVLQRNSAAGYMYTPLWDFELGYAKLNHLEPDANVYIERFLYAYKGNFYVKDALHKLSWYHWLHGNTARYNECVQLIKKRGSTETDADKKALKEATSGSVPNTLLLKARLLSDGGYYSEAYTLLAGKTMADFNRDEDKNEFAYRAARIYEELHHYDEAIQAYLGCIKIGKTRTEYYAARSALQIGMIYEQQKNNKQAAITYYQQCIDMKDHDYKNSLDQKAKAGLARCKGE